MRVISIIGLLIVAIIGGMLFERAIIQAAPAHKNIPIEKSLVTVQVSDPATLQYVKKQCNAQFVSSSQLSSVKIPISIPITGRLAFDAKYTQQVSARSAGRLNRIFVFEGMHVKAGEPVAELYSPDYISAQYEYLLAKKTLQTLQSSRDTGLISDAKATFAAAKMRLNNLGVWPQDIADLEQRNFPAQYQLLRTPLPGVVAKRNFEQGAYMNIGDDLMTVVDPEKLWFFGNIYEDDYAKVKLDQKLILETPALPNQEFTGAVDFIAPGIDPTTHILQISCDVLNPKGELRPDLFVNAKLITGEQLALVAPVSAIVTNKNQGYVIIDKGDNRYQRQAVKYVKSTENSDQVEIYSGLHGNERVVTDGAVLLNAMFGEA